MIDDVTPIILGSDFNAYGVARSFYEINGQKVQAFAGAELSPTRFTKIMDVKIISGFSEDPVFIDAMRNIMKRYQNHSNKLILLGMGDGYAELISKHKSELEKIFICPYIDYDLLKQLNNKKAFYNICDQYGLKYPATKFINKAYFEKNMNFKSPFDFPVALKPADSVSWLKVDFKGRKKAFRVQSQVELDDIICKIYENGYDGDLILQDFIPGDDSKMRVLNAYVDQNHQVKMMCLGHPLLEDPSPSAIGNYVAILPEYNMDLYQMVKQFLEKINYVGFANFDMKYDERDGKFKVFEINIRQGRSSFFVTLNGYNLVQYLIDDYGNHSLSSRATVYANKDQIGHKLWLGVSKSIFKKYSRDNDYKKKALRLLDDHKYGFTAIYNKDKNLKRSLLISRINYHYYKNFKKYFKENKG